MNILFPIIQVIEDLQWNSLDIISHNNHMLADELKDMPPMTAQEIKKYIESRKD